jgi:hypothetical protein
MMGENLKVVIFEVSSLSKAIDVYLQMSMVAFFRRYVCTPLYTCMPASRVKKLSPYFVLGRTF